MGELQMHREPPVRRPAGVVVEYDQTVPTVRVVGRATHERVAEVSETIHRLAAVGVRDMVVDLTDSYDGAELLSVLARRRAELTDVGGSLMLTGVALPELLAGLVVARLDEVFLVFDAVRRARPPMREPMTPAGHDAGEGLAGAPDADPVITLDATAGPGRHRRRRW